MSVSTSIFTFVPTFFPSNVTNNCTDNIPFRDITPQTIVKTDHFPFERKNTEVTVKLYTVPTKKPTCFPLSVHWWKEVTFDVALMVMLLQQTAVVGQLLVFVRLSQEIGPRGQAAAVLRQ